MCTRSLSSDFVVWLLLALLLVGRFYFRLFVRSHFGSPYLLNGERELVTTIFSHSLTYYHIQCCWMQWLNCVQNIDNGQWMATEWLRQECLHLWWALAIKSTDNMHRPYMKTSTHIWILHIFFRSVQISYDLGSPTIHTYICQPQISV